MMSSCLIPVNSVFMPKSEYFLTSTTLHSSTFLLVHSTYPGDKSELELHELQALIFVTWTDPYSRPWIHPSFRQHSGYVRHFE